MLDTLKYAEALRAAGVDERQAAAHANALKQAASEGLATKSDIRLIQWEIGIVAALVLVDIAAGLAA
jgi:hypothetical protein